MNNSNSSGETAETPFRRILTSLLPAREDNPDWPLAFTSSIYELFQHQRSCEISYSGKHVFIDRDDKCAEAASIGSEKSLTRLLFQKCRSDSSACLTIGDERFWLVSYEVPNFSNRSHQSADLVGLTIDGGLVVFECKIETNSYAPITSLIEGLDYLSCLLSQSNFARFQKELLVWKSKANQIVPKGFENTEPCSSARHQVVVLAPKSYYDKYQSPNDGEKVPRSSRGLGWERVAKLGGTAHDKLLLRFARTDFDQTSAEWV